MESCQLYSYWRSSASWRVRIALNLKCIPHTIIPVNLLKGEQLDPHYVNNLNPGKVIPTLVWKKKSADGVEEDVVLNQSVSIMEFLEEITQDDPNSVALLPKDVYQRAKVRTLVNLIIADIHPIQNLRVLKKVAELGGGGSEGDQKKMEWGKEWIQKGFEAFEKMLESSMGQYCVGDHVTLADICLVPQVYNAVRFSVDMTAFPRIMAIHERLSSLDAFIKAHPQQQVDAVA